MADTLTPGHLDPGGPADDAATGLEVRSLDVTLRSAGRDLHLVRDVSFSVRPGERFGLIGESGCGKTTTLLALMGLLSDNATIGGQVRIGGCDILAGGERGVRSHRWRDISVVFQSAMNSLNPVHTIGRQVREAASRAAGLPTAPGGGPRTATSARVTEVLELVGLRAEVAQMYPHELSGGMRQRAAIAMAVVCEPQVLLADEPTTALDVIVQAQVLTALERACAETGAALVLVSHDIGVIGEVCDRAAVMYGGQIVETGSIGQLLDRPAHPYTQLLVKASPSLDTPGRALASIPGSAPPAGVEFAGCGFASRCPSRFEPCVIHPPALVAAPDRRPLCGSAGHAPAGSSVGIPAGTSAGTPASHAARCHLIQVALPAPGHMP